jgi:hypothetical protein
MLPDARRGQNREVYIQPMNCAERVAGHVNGETVVAAGLFQRHGTAAAIGDEGDCPPARTRSARHRGFRRTRFSRPRSLDPDFIDWDPEDMDTWDERIVMVADDEDFLEWRRDWLTDHGRA